MAKVTLLLVVFLLDIISSIGRGGIIPGVQAQLSQDFYDLSCPAVQSIVRSRMTAHYNGNPAIAAHILRLHFHDCAATGCDASLLLTGPNSEQEAQPNLTLLGFDIIDDIKAQLEVSCPGVVSCADIMTMAARDAVSLTQGPDYQVPLGRFDSTFSGGLGVRLPNANISVANALAFFKPMHLDATNIVGLLGAHTIGATHCGSIDDRLYNFNGFPGTSDPSIAPTFLPVLQSTCPNPGPNGSPNNATILTLDQGTQQVFDNSYYVQTTLGKGVLGIDEELFNSQLTNTKMVEMSVNQTAFFFNFVDSIIKLGVYNVSDATTGNIRSVCSVVNTSPADHPSAHSRKKVMKTVPAPSIAPANFDFP